MTTGRAKWFLRASASALLAVSCGGSKTPPEAPNASEAKTSAADAKTSDDPPAEETTAAPTTADGLPKECAKKGGTCVPPKGFVQKLCSGSYPAVGLYLFANKSPWTHGYLRGRTKAWNASGGASDNGWLEFDEEVLILAERKADTGGMQVSGAGASYDALRWDGSCVTLSSEEVTLDKPPAPKSAKVEWRFLDDNVQEALRANEAVNKAYLGRRQECKGATSGDVSMKCVKADQKLSDEIVAYVRSGGSLPAPTKRP
jgi:hypothetical protein